jgi:RecA/RadA recombinase
MTYQEKTISVKELKELYHSNEYDIELDTPDGYQAIGEWFNKGVLDMVMITTPTYETTCAVNHMVQLKSGEWILASEIEPGVEILTLTGPEPVIGIVPTDSAECYDFEIMHENHRYYGDGIVSHNSGKSFICAGNLVKSAQDMGVFVVLIDSENALDESWLKALNVDTSEDKLLKLNMAMIDDVAKVISDFVTEYRAGYGDVPVDERPEVLFVIDSLGMLMSPTDLKQFEAGEMKGDMGRKPRQLKALVTNCVNMFGDLNIGLVATNHTYASQDMFDPDPKISGGAGMVFASSIVVALRKLKLKEDDAGNKTSEVFGIRAACKVVKSRYAKPFESVQIKIPYTSGMNPYSGLVDFFEGHSVLTKSGNSLEYIDKESGEVYKMFRKAWERNDHNRLDTIMAQYDMVEPEAEIVESEDEIDAAAATDETSE